VKALHVVIMYRKGYEQGLGGKYRHKSDVLSEILNGRYTTTVTDEGSVGPEEKGEEASWSDSLLLWKWWLRQRCTDKAMLQ
jgi:hypothetical protein